MSFSSLPFCVSRLFYHDAIQEPAYDTNITSHHDLNLMSLNIQKGGNRTLYRNLEDADYKHHDVSGGLIGVGYTDYSTGGYKNGMGLLGDYIDDTNPVEGGYNDLGGDYNDLGAGSYMDDPWLDVSTSSSGWHSIEAILPAVCVLGVVGNSLSLLVLTRQKLLSGLEKLERSATYGLASLAISDLLFCLVVLPSPLATGSQHSSPPAGLFHLHYKLYGVALINLFLMISAWLVVVISVNRLLVVTRPLRARHLLTGTNTMLAVCVTYVIAIALTLPHFLILGIYECQTVDGVTLLEMGERWGPRTTHALGIYIRWVWPILASFVPLVILAFCNGHIVRGLRHARLERSRLSGRGQKIKDTNQRVTLTLIIMVIMFFVLVVPAEVLKYINPYSHWGSAGVVVASVVNVLQALNFCCNFLLYCAVNPNFRRTLRATLMSCLCWKRKDNNFSQMSVRSRYSSYRDRTTVTRYDGDGESSTFV